MKPDYIEMDLYDKILKEIKKYGLPSIKFNFRGEPLMHPDICEIIRNAHSCRLKIGMSTNGGLLWDKNRQNAILDCNTYLRVSLDAGTDKTHNKLHGSKGKEYSKILS